MVDSGEPDLLDRAAARRVRQGACRWPSIAFGLIASAVCALLGPIFVPFFIVPKLDWLFWGWLKSFIQYSFIPVVAIAFLMIFEQFVFRYVTTLPPTITQAEYGVYALQAFAVDRDVLRRHPAGAVADQFDLLGPQRRERAAVTINVGRLFRR